MTYLGKQKNYLPSSQVSSFLGDKTSVSANPNTGNGLELISGGTSTGNLSFSNLNTYSYNHLMFISCLNTTAQTETSMIIRFNGSSTASNYSTYSAYRGFNNSSNNAAPVQSYGDTYDGIYPNLYGGNHGSAARFNLIMYVYNYQSSNVTKQVEIFSGIARDADLSNTGQPAGTSMIQLTTGAFHSTSAITSMSVTPPSLDAHTWSLYGIR
jgi:hypothetical protein